MKIFSCRKRKVIPRAGNLQLLLISAMFALTLGFSLLSGISWADTHTAASCSAADVNAAISSASAEDIVVVPSGSCSWSSGVNLNKSITLRGNGIGSTIITAGNVNISATAARLTGFAFTNATVNAYANDFRIDNNAFSASGVEVSGCTRGVIYSNTFTTSSSSAELIHVYGPSDAWKTDSTMGTAENIFVEDNSFIGNGGSSQCVQGNYNARVVFRYNTVSGMKFDMHGIWSNGSPSHYLNWTSYTDPGYISDAHSARHCEVYNNSFASIYPWGMELRGGTGVVFNNTIQISGGGDSIVLRDYCTSVGTDGNCARCMCPADYPLRDQIGRGKNQTSEPMYLWNNTANGKQVVGWTGTFDNSPYGIVFEGEPSSSCVSYCGSQVGYRYPGATMSDLTAIIKENRDYYIMQKPGYTPYAYPHPLRFSIMSPQNVKVKTIE